MENYLKIVICDDEESANSIISASVEALLASKGIRAEIQKFLSAKKCYQYLKANGADLLFLDIAMPEIDGIAMAKKMRSQELGHFPDIIFVSNNQNRVFDSFQVSPVGFVRKDNFMSDISYVMKNYVETKLSGQKSEKRFELRDGNSVTVLKAAKVLYIESYRKTQNVYLTSGETILLHATLDRLYEQVQDCNFIRIHKGYIVNCQHIENFGRSEVRLSSGNQLPVGRAYYKGAMEQYLTYIRENGIQSIG